MLHIPAGREHRHKPTVAGDEVVRYVLTEFGPPNLDSEIPGR